jgi:hypothetical protein
MFVFRLDDDEAACFRETAKRSCVSQEAYIRFLINGKRPQDRPPPDYFAFVREVRAIGNNINQIARVANATGVIDADGFRRCYDELARLLDRLRDDIELPRRI